MPIARASSCGVSGAHGNSVLSIQVYWFFTQSHFRAKLGTVFLEPPDSPPPAQLTSPGCWAPGSLGDRTLCRVLSGLCPPDPGGQRRSQSPTSHGGPAACHRIRLPAGPAAPVRGSAGDSGEPQTHPGSRWVPLGDPGGHSGGGVCHRKETTHTLRSVKAPGARCSARGTVCARCNENTGPITGVNHALMSPGAGASPLLLQTLCLRALSKHLSRLSLQDTVDLKKMASKRQLPKVSQVTDEKLISKALGIDRE